MITFFVVLCSSGLIQIVSMQITLHSQSTNVFPINVAIFEIISFFLTNSDFINNGKAKMDH